MVIKRVLVTIEGESKEGGKKKKEGEGEDNITEQLKGFWSPYSCGDQNLLIAIV